MGGKGAKCLPGSASCPSDATPDGAGAPGLEVDTAGSCPAFHPQEPPVLLFRAALNEFISQTLLLSGITPTQAHRPQIPEFCACPHLPKPRVGVNKAKNPQRRVPSPCKSWREIRVCADSAGLPISLRFPHWRRSAAPPSLRGQERSAPVALCAAAASGSRGARSAAGKAHSPACRTDPANRNGGAPWIRLEPVT